MTTEERTRLTVDQRVGRVLSLVGVVGLIFLMLWTTADVIARKLGSSVPAALELSEPILCLVAVTGLAEGQRLRDHVYTDVVTSRLPNVVRRAVTTLALLAATGLVLWIACLSIPEAWSSLRSGEYRLGIYEIPLWPARAGLALAWLLLSMALLRTAWSMFTGQEDGPEGRHPLDDVDTAGGGL
jgi:TRAP-type C4-dicarboxylate transport system permease small subunit